MASQAWPKIDTVSCRLYKASAAADTSHCATNPCIAFAGDDFLSFRERSVADQTAPSPTRHEAAFFPTILPLVCDLSGQLFLDVVKHLEMSFLGNLQGSYELPCLIMTYFWYRVQVS